MFEVTLGELISSGRLKACSVIAGEQGLNRLARGVLRIRNPFTVHLPVSFVIGADEDIFAGRPEHLRSFLRYCSSSRCAGVAIVARSTDSNLDDAVSTAEQLGLPLIKVDPGQDISDWILAVANEIRTASAEKTNEARRIEYQLRNKVLDGAGLNTIAKLVSKHMDNPLLIVDSHRRLIAGGWPGATKDSLNIANYLKDAVQNNLVLDEVEEDIHRRLHETAPKTYKGKSRVRTYQKTVLVGGRSVGTVRVLEVKSALVYGDMQFLDYVASLVAFQMFKEISINQERLRLQGKLVDDVVNGRIAQKSFQTLVKTAGWEPHSKFLVIVCELSDSRGIQVSAAIRELPALLEVVSRVFSLESHKVLAGIVNNMVAVVFSRISSEKDLDELLLKLKRECDVSLSPVLVSIGASDVFGEVEDIPSRFLEACQVLELGGKLYGPGKLSYVSDVGAHRFLFGMSEKEMRSLITAELGPLGLDDDDAWDLKETLLAYFRCDGSVAAAAEICNLHPSTIKYRLSKIWGGRRPNYDEKVGVYLALLADCLLRKGFAK